MKNISNIFAAALMLVAIALSLPTLALAIDTSEEPCNRSDLNDFGSWIYSQHNTDLDLVIEHQEDASATFEDSLAALTAVVRETIPRRVAWLQRQVTVKQAGPVLSDSARTALRIQFCRNELLALKDTCDLIEIAASKKAAETHRQQVLAKIDSTVQANLAIQAGNASLDSLIEKLRERGFGAEGESEFTFNPEDYNLVTATSLEETINSATEERFAAIEERVDIVERRLDEHMDQPYKKAHPDK